LENINSNYNNKDSYILLHRQAALHCFHINSELVWSCLQSLMTLTECNSITGMGARM